MVKQFYSSINGILSSATTLRLNGPGSNGSQRELHIFQSSKSEDLPSDGLMSSPGHSLGRMSSPYVKMHSAYSTAPANWAELKVKYHTCHPQTLVWESCDKTSVKTGVRPHYRLLFVLSFFFTFVGLTQGSHYFDQHRQPSLKANNCTWF